MPVSRDPLREQLARFLDWEEAHVSFDKAVAGVPVKGQGTVPPGFEHSTWQLLEHLRIAQADIYDFCVNRKYRHKKWPDDYWPKAPAPPDGRAWRASVASYRADRKKFQALARDASIDLFAAIPHGDGQTYIREILLAVDHASYHVGQIIAVRRALGLWPA
jgi:hypothetical protein